MNIKKVNSLPTHQLKYPSFEVVLKLKDVLLARKTYLKIKNISNDLEEIKYQFTSVEEESEIISLLINYFQSKAGFSVYQLSKFFIENDTVRFYIPTPNILEALEVYLYKSIFKLLYSNNIEKDYLILLNWLKDNKKYINPMSNTPHLIKAAIELGIPFWRVNTDVILFGYGRNSIWNRSTASEHTSTTAVFIARDKFLCGKILSSAGIPVAPKIRFTNKLNLSKFVNDIGYPFVVKPANLDGGRNVYVNIHNEHDLINAIKNVQKVTNNVLVEKHILGSDTRCQVIDGKVVWTIKRTPAFVIGDGKNTIIKLIENENENRKISISNNSSHGLIQINDDLHKTLSKQQLEISDTPAKGQFVALSFISNVSSGGLPEVIKNVHPDNIDLVENAVSLLSLNTAGVDLIIPNPSVSYKDNGGVICEINAIPQFGSISHKHLYHEYLNKNVNNFGKIPIILCLGNINNNFLINELVDLAGVNEINIAIITINNENKNAYLKMLHSELIKKSVAAIVISICDFDIIEKSWGVSEFDYLIVSDNYPDFDYIQLYNAKYKLTKKLLKYSACLEYSPLYFYNKIFELRG